MKDRSKGLGWLRFVIAALILLAGGHAQAQQTPYAIHANIVYRFTKYINWPDDRKSGDFVIGIVGDTPLYEELKSFIGNKMAGGQKIVIRKYASNAPAYNCHILFISEFESRNIKRIVAATSDAAVLLVTESDGMARKGACINFTIVEERLKLEINKSTIEKRDLDIASELLNLGLLVK